MIVLTLIGLASHDTIKLLQCKNWQPPVRNLSFVQKIRLLNGVVSVAMETICTYRYHYFHISVLISILASVNDKKVRYYSVSVHKNSIEALKA